MNLKSKINLLDCTLRDGGYYNNWDFSRRIYRNYFNSIKNTKIEAIEIGFRFPQKNFYLGPFAFSTDSFLLKERIQHKNLAIMINAADLINNCHNINYLSFYLNKRSVSPVRIVRVAAHSHEILKIKDLLKDIKKMGYRVFLNIMQISTINNFELKKIIKSVDKETVDVLYFADSLGNLVPKRVGEICNIFKNFWIKDFGFHSHDNKGFAYKNCLIAIKNGANWIDGTILGMGRGAGNVKIEKLLKFFFKNRKKYNLKSLAKSLDDFKILKKKYKWGKSNIYSFAADNSIHPTYVQSLLDLGTLNEDQIIKILKDLNKCSLTRYDSETLNIILENSSKKNNVGSWNAKNFLLNKNVLLLARGDEVVKNYYYIEQFIKAYNPKVMCLNYLDNVYKKYIDYYAFSHFERLIYYKKIMKKIKNNIILPVARLDQINNNNNKFKYNYGLQVKKNTFQVKNNFAILPNNLVFAYALALCKIGGVNNIYLAGFNGNIEGKKYLEMIETINIIKKNYQVNLFSLFSTKYPITVKSIFSLI
jgi:4-hydroxy 2-oxovalerate aldolase